MKIFKIQHIEHTNPVEKCLSGLSRYQYFVFALIFSTKAPLFWHIINLIFLSADMKHTCEDANKTADACDCEKVKFDTSVFTETIVSKYQLYCTRYWLIAFSNSMAFFGALLGGPTFGFISDKFGRLNTFCVTLLVVGTGGMLAAVMPNITLYIIARIIEGFGAGGGIVTSYVLCIEFTSAEYREIVTALFHVPLNVGHMTIPIISYILRDMTHFQIALSIPMFFLASLKLLISESPKWLMDNQRYDELEKSLKKICPASANTIRSDIDEYHRSHTDVKKIQFWHIFKFKSLVINFFCMGFNYFVCGMGYYGVSQFIGKMSGNIHLNVFISATVILPGTIICTVLLGMFARKHFLMSTNTAAGVFMIVVVAVPRSLPWLRILCACLSNCFFFMSFIIVFLYGVELFPTQVRNSVLGVLSLVSRVGQTLVPPINALSQTVAGITFGLMAIIGAILCIPLPDTKNKELPSTLEEVANNESTKKEGQAAGAKKGGLAAGAKTEDKAAGAKKVDQAAGAEKEDQAASSKKEDQAASAKKEDQAASAKKEDQAAGAKKGGEAAGAKKGDEAAAKPAEPSVKM